MRLPILDGVPIQQFQPQHAVGAAPPRPHEIMLQQPGGPSFGHLQVRMRSPEGKQTVEEAVLCSRETSNREADNLVVVGFCRGSTPLELPSTVHTRPRPPCTCRDRTNGTRQYQHHVGAPGRTGTYPAPESPLREKAPGQRLHARCTQQQRRNSLWRHRCRPAPYEPTEAFLRGGLVDAWQSVHMNSVCSSTCSTSVPRIPRHSGWNLHGAVAAQPV
jgi:hypothetical protein